MELTHGVIKANIAFYKTVSISTFGFAITFISTFSTSSTFVTAITATTLPLQAGAKNGKQVLTTPCS